MRDTVAARPFFLVNMDPDANRRAMEGVREFLLLKKIPFKVVKSFRGKELLSYGFILDADDRTAAEDIAIAHNQTHFISVDAFRIGLRIAVDRRPSSDIDLLGTLEVVTCARLKPDEAYLSVNNVFYHWV